MRGILAELGYSQNIILHTDDSESAIKLVGELCNIGNNSMHIVMRINFIHESIVAGIIRLIYVNTDNEA